MEGFFSWMSDWLPKSVRTRRSACEPKTNDSAIVDAR